MTRFLTLLATLLLAPLAQAESSLDATINAAVAPVSSLITQVVFYSVTVAGHSLPLIVVWLVAAALFFTVYFGFINLRGFGHGIRVVRGDYSDPRDKGEVSHFQALTAALSGTVGLGNIAGVALAISIGGPGATFWMIVGGLLAPTVKGELKRYRQRIRSGDIVNQRQATARAMVRETPARD